MSKTDVTIKIKPNLALREPPLFNIIYLNDEVTSMTFVVSSLVDYFNYTMDNAYTVAENIHETGKAVVAIMPYELAVQLGMEVTESARAQGFPLLIKVEATL